MTASLCALGCWSGGSHVRPGLERSAVPAPTLLSRTVDCRGGTSGVDGGKQIVSSTNYGASMLGAVDARVLSLGPALPPFSSELCGDLFADASRDEDDWSQPRPPPGVAKLLARYRAAALLVPAVGSEWQCLSEGELATSCKENRVTLVAYLMTADSVIWKSEWNLAIGNETPDLDDGASKLFEGVPLARVARLQDPNAPTYEEAIREAGAEP